MGRPLRTFTTLALACLAIALATASAAAAATFQVTRTDDPLPDRCLAGDCSLREATLAAAESEGDDEIVLRAGRGPYELTQPDVAAEGQAEAMGGDLDVDPGGLKISRADGRYATIDANRLDRVLDVASGSGLKLARLTLTGGRSPEGGGALRAAANLKLTRVTLRGNAALAGGGALSLGAGTTRVKASTVNDNEAVRGGAIAVEPGARLVAINSTFAGNRSTGSGGAISAAGPVMLNAVTVAHNVADLDADGDGSGGGLASETGAFVVENTLIASNRLGSAARSDCAGRFDSDGDNLLRSPDPSGCSGIDFAGDIRGRNPRIGKLRDNGGPTRTVALKRRSPAIDEAGPQSSPRRDQRNFKRDDLPDIGAYERRGGPFAVPAVPDRDSPPAR